MKKALIPFIFLLFICSNSWATDYIEEQKEFHSEIQSLYNFQPHTLNKEEIKEKSDLLDQFWSKVETDKSRYLPWLRIELQNDLNPSFFFYDGSKLLLSLSESSEDKLIALKAIPRADLRDIQHTDYLRTVHRLATDEMDTSEAALRILDYPNFKAAIPLHALILDQNFCLIYMLIPTKENFYLQKLCDRLKTENDETAQKSLIEMLWYTATEEGDQAIEEFLLNTNKSETKNWVEKLLERGTDIPSFLKISLSSITSLKKERKEVMHRISDEALIEFDKLTARMRAKR